jgi:hypothetical protein
MMESPEAANEIARPMVLQALAEVVHALMSFPVTPFTYQVLATAAGAMARSRTTTGRVRKCPDLMSISSLSDVSSRCDCAEEEQIERNRATNSSPLRYC